MGDAFDCPRCGAAVDADWRYCPSCGYAAPTLITQTGLLALVAFVLGVAVLYLTFN